jgi:hypothetical protein
MRSPPGRHPVARLRTSCELPRESLVDRTEAAPEARLRHRTGPSPLPEFAALLTLAVSLVAGAGYGWLWLRLLRVRPGPLVLLHAVALGLGTLAYLVLAAGLLHALTPPVLGALVAAGWVPALLYARASRARKPLPAADPQAMTAPTQAEQGLTLLAVAFLGLLALATLLSVFKPVDGLDWDSLSYHLAAPKIYLRERRIPFIAYDSHTHFPFTMEMLYTLGLQFGGTSGAKLFHWACGWLTAGAVGVWTAHREVDGRRVPAWAGPVAALAFASMPLVLWAMGTAYVDLGTSLFQFLALAALVDGVSFPRARPAARLGMAALAGVLSGFALGTKMTALLQFGLLGLGLLWVVGRSEARGAALRATAAFGALGVLVAAPWYLKSWLWVHNPVYPFFYSLFPQSFSWNAGMADAYGGEQTAFGVGKGPGELVGLPWNVAMHGRAFFINIRSLVGDKLGSLGPVWAGITPLTLWTRGLEWPVRAFLLYTLASVALWFPLTQQSRYLVPVLAPLSAVVAIVLVALPSRGLRLAAGVFLGAAFLCNLAMHAELAVRSAQVLGLPNKAEYLYSSLPGLYEASEYVNTLPEGSRVALYGETRGFYLDRSYFWANPGHNHLIPYEELKDGDGLADALRRFGTTHVLMNFQFGPRPQEAQPAWYTLLMDAVQRGRLKARFMSTKHDPKMRPVVVYELR